MSLRRSLGIRGLPTGRDFQRQRRRNPLRCQRTKVSGRTFSRASRQFAAVEAGGAEEFLDQLRLELVQRTYRPQKARKVEDPTALVLDHEEAVQHTETQRGHGEKVEGGAHLAVVLEECPPALHLRLVGLALQPLQIARHGGYRNLKSEVQQFPVDARRSLTAPRQANSQNELPICPPTATVPETGTPENSA